MHAALAAASTISAASPIDPGHLLNSYGLAGLAVIIFAECGLLIGFFLPGDTLLLVAGIGLAVSAGNADHVSGSLALYLVVTPLAAIAGNLVGYWIGYRAGPRVFDRPNSKIFSPDYVNRAEAFFTRFGAWTIILARFVPIVRTVATVMAGVGRMRFSLYALYSVVGGVIWADGVLLLGHQLGKFKFVQDNKQYLDYVIVAVVILSLIPTAIHYLRGRKRLAAGSTDQTAPLAASVDSSANTLD